MNYVTLRVWEKWAEALQLIQIYADSEPGAHIGTGTLIWREVRWPRFNACKEQIAHSDIPKDWVTFVYPGEDNEKDHRIELKPFPDCQF